MSSGVSINNRAAAALIAERIASGLCHPGDEHTKPTPLLIPGLSGTGIPPEQAADFASAAGLPSNDAPRLFGEALVSLIETELAGGSTIVANTELAALRQAAADAPTGTRVIRWHCQCDNMLATPLLELVIGNDNRVITNAKPILTALHSRSIDCPHNVVPEQ